jgi:MbtH protein
MILDEEDTILDVVVNDEGQYSIWPSSKLLPEGWHKAGKRGRKAECIAFIESVWSDIRPRSLIA